MSIIHEIVDIFVLFVAQNRQAIEEPNKVLFNSVYESSRHFLCPLHENLLICSD